MRGRQASTMWRVRSRSACLRTLGGRTCYDDVVGAQSDGQREGDGQHHGRVQRCPPGAPLAADTQPGHDIAHWHVLMCAGADDCMVCDGGRQVRVGGARAHHETAVGSGGGGGGQALRCSFVGDSRCNVAQREAVGTQDAVNTGEVAAGAAVACAGTAESAAPEHASVDADFENNRLLCARILNPPEARAPSGGSRGDNVENSVTGSEAAGANGAGKRERGGSCSCRMRCW